MPVPLRLYVVSIKLKMSLIYLGPLLFEHLTMHTIFDLLVINRQQNHDQRLTGSKLNILQ